jgi:serine/threonine protein kinase
VVQGVPFVIVEYLNGGNLRPWISSGRSAHLRVGLSLGIQLCHALEHAHAQGTWHSALMPENLLLTAEGVLRVSDFWTSSRPRAAAAPASATASRAAKRADRPSDAYVAPELWVDAAELDAQTDIFALGICLYEIFCGARPYEIARGPRRSPPEPRAPGDRALPERLATVLKQCVDWDQERRPLTVADIRHELAEVHQQMFGRACPFAELPNQSWEADGWNNQALVALRQGRLADATVAWEHALAAQPSHPETAYNYGVSRWRAGDATDEALLRHLEDVAGVPGQTWTARYLLALVHLERGDAHAALGLLENIAPEARVPEVDVALAEARAQAQNPPPSRACSVSTAVSSPASASATTGAGCCRAATTTRCG